MVVKALLQHPWAIEWTNNGSFLAVSVFRPGSGLPVGIPVNTGEQGQDTSFVYESGTFYLTINALGGWTVRVIDVPS